MVAKKKKATKKKITKQQEVTAVDTNKEVASTEKVIAGYSTTFKGKKRTETFLIRAFGPNEFRTVRVSQEDYEGDRLLKKDVSNWEKDKDSRKAVVKDATEVEEQAKSYLDLKKDIFDSYEVRPLTESEMEVEMTTMYI